ncbi:MAG TPA: hypothetical protein VNE71_04830, partial [Myxococcota bacterium]|nr:hypothetical protein [Myxococcota bacterium]
MPLSQLDTAKPKSSPAGAIAVAISGWGDHSSQDPELCGSPSDSAIAPAGDDFGFAVSSWDKGIDPWSFGFDPGTERRAGIAHTVLD